MVKGYLVKLRGRVIQRSAITLDGTLEFRKLEAKNRNEAVSKAKKIASSIGINTAVDEVFKEKDEWWPKEEGIKCR